MYRFKSDRLYQGS